jgi:hypothetical protein
MFSRVHDKNKLLTFANKNTFSESESEPSSADYTPQSGPLGKPPPPSSTAQLEQRVSQLEERAPAAASDALLQQLDALQKQVKNAASASALDRLAQKLQKQDKETHESLQEQIVAVSSGLTAKINNLDTRVGAIDVDSIRSSIQTLNEKSVRAATAASDMDDKLKALNTRLDGLQSATAPLDELKSDAEKEYAKVADVLERHEQSLKTLATHAEVQSTMDELKSEMTRTMARFDEISKAPSAAAIDEKAIRRIANDVVVDRVGDVNHAKVAIEKLTADAKTTLTAAVDALTEKNAAAVGEMKAEVKDALGTLEQWTAAEQARIAEGADTIGALVNEARAIADESMYQNQVWNVAREKAKLGISPEQIQKAIELVETNPNNIAIREVFSKVPPEKWAHARQGHGTPFDLSKLDPSLRDSPLTRDACDMHSGPQRLARRASSDNTPTGPGAQHKPTARGAVKPAGYAREAASGGSDTFPKFQFHSQFDETPYLFADRPTWPI